MTEIIEQTGFQPSNSTVAQLAVCVNKLTREQGEWERERERTDNYM